MDDLALQLKDAVTDATDVIGTRRPPVPFFFGFELSIQNSEQHRAFSGLVGATALIRMFSAKNIIAMRKSCKQSRPYSLGELNEFVTAFNETAEATMKALTAGPLSTMYKKADTGSTQTEEQLLERADLHAFVLLRIFGGLNQIKKQYMADLEKVLTRFVESFKPCRVGNLPEEGSEETEDSQQATIQPEKQEGVDQTRRPDPLR
jgi:hypothetical protein